MKSLIKKLFGFMGYQIIKKQSPELDAKGMLNPYSRIKLKNSSLLDLQKLEAIGNNILGMISSISGCNLFSICLFQQEKGDIVEIGSWQGRSTTFLAYAALGSKNGRVWAIDHFKGNVGKEHHYIVKNRDLSDLKEGFKKNIERVGLSSYITLLDMPNNEAAEHIKDKSVRFLFIDGDHTKEGVKKDLDLFLPKLVDGAIIAFDDFSNAFPGVIEAVDDFLQEEKYSQAMTYANTLVIRWKPTKSL